MNAPKGAATKDVSGGGGYYVTAAMLRKRGACEGQVRLFERTFGKRRVLLTLENVRKAQKAGLSVLWPATNPYWEAPFGSPSLKASITLMHAAWGADTDTKILKVLMSAPRVWRMVDKDRAALSEQQS